MVTNNISRHVNTYNFQKCWQFYFPEMLPIIISRDVSNSSFQKCQQLYIFRNADNCYYLSVVVRPLSVRLSRRRRPFSVRPPVVCLNITCKTSRSINYDQIDKQIHRSLEERGPKLEMLSKRLEKNERSYCYSPKPNTPNPNT